MQPAARQGLTEYLIVFAVLAIGAAGAVALFGDDVRSLLGLRPASASATPAAGQRPIR